MPSTSTLSKAIALVLRKGGSFLSRLSLSIYEPPKPVPIIDPQQQIVDRWFAERGDHLLRLNYDLNEHSVVFDLGGYEGQWASDIFAKYCCQVHVFEPVGSFASQIKGRFSRNSRVKVHEFGLASTTRKVRIALAENGSSILKESETSEEIQLLGAADFLEREQIGKIDLMKINIEGAEYDLLGHLIETGAISNISNIQVQFHNFFPEAPEQMKALQDALSDTHRLTWQYPFVWENWELKAREG